MRRGSKSKNRVRFQECQLLSLNSSRQYHPSGNRRLVEGPLTDIESIDSGYDTVSSPVNYRSGLSYDEESDDEYGDEDEDEEYSYN